MTPQQFKEARRQLGLSTNKMARALGLADGRTVRRYEKGDRVPDGSTLKLLRVLLDARCPGWILDSSKNVES